MKHLDPAALRVALSRAQARRRRRKGMNLIEIMIVVAIIVILISVLSVGAFQAWEAWKVRQTQLKINQLGQMVFSEIMLAGSDVPQSLKDVEGVNEDMMKDGWGRDLEYVTPGPGDAPFEIISYGRDGAEGGSGRDQDLKYTEMK
jgi:general secretion pathway protein G